MLAQGSVSGTPVDRLPQQVQVTEMASVLLEQVGEDPAQRQRLSVAQSEHAGVEVCPARLGGAGGVELPAVAVDAGE